MQSLRRRWAAPGTRMCSCIALTARPPPKRNPAVRRALGEGEAAAGVAEAGAAEGLCSNRVTGSARRKGACPPSAPGVRRRH